MELLANPTATSREIEQKRPLVGRFEVERPVVSTREANKASWFDRLARRYLRYRQSDWGRTMTDWARAGQYWNDRMHGIRPTRPPPIPSDRVEEYFRDRENRKDNPPPNVWPPKETGD